MAREREFVEEGIKKADIKEFLRDNLQKAKFGGVDIRRTALRTRMIIYAERPGLIIGRRGRNIKDLTEALEQRYGFENLQIEVEEISIPELNPHIMASRIAAMLKAGRPFRRSAYMNLDKIMEAGAHGVEITISGKIRGERARSVRFVRGTITKCGEPSKQVLKGLAVADLKQGSMGIKVKIMPPNAKMPDHVDLDALKEKAARKAEEAGPAEKTLEVVEPAAEGELTVEASGDGAAEQPDEELLGEEEAEEPGEAGGQPEGKEEPGSAEELRIDVRDVPPDETGDQGSAEDGAESGEALDGEDAGKQG